LLHVVQQAARVAMTISTPARRMAVCGFMSTPPKTTVERSGVKRQ
jgi:hypothetical protein